MVMYEIRQHKDLTTRLGNCVAVQMAATDAREVTLDRRL